MTVYLVISLQKNIVYAPYMVLANPTCTPFTTTPLRNHHFCSWRCRTSSAPRVRRKSRNRTGSWKKQAVSSYRCACLHRCKRVHRAAGAHACADGTECIELKLRMPTQMEQSAWSCRCACLHRWNRVHRAAGAHACADVKECIELQVRMLAQM